MVSKIIAITPTDVVGVSVQPLNPLPELRVQRRIFLPQQLRHLMQNRFETVVVGLVDVAKLSRELRAVLHVSQHQVNCACQVARGPAVIADRFARLGQFELSESS